MKHQQFNNFRKNHLRRQNPNLQENDILNSDLNVVEHAPDAIQIVGENYNPDVHMPKYSNTIGNFKIKPVVPILTAL